MRCPPIGACSRQEGVERTSRANGTRVCRNDNAGYIPTNVLSLSSLKNGPPAPSPLHAGSRKMGEAQWSQRANGFPKAANGDRVR